MSISKFDYLHYTWQILSGFRTCFEQEICERRRQDIAPYFDQQSQLRVLDLANGRLQPQYILLKLDRHQVHGIDLVNRPSLNRKDLAYAVARRLFIWNLGVPHKPYVGDTLVCGDVGRLPFPNAWFDLVTSVAAFEHFLDIPNVVAELDRVLRPGGIAWIWIHLFSCPTGGHNLSFSQYPLRSMPTGVDPWDHLRTRKRPFFVPLNQWRKHQYVEVFARHFEILENYCAIREGEELLTSEIEAELAEYSRDELTCAAFIIVARKPI